MQVLFRKSFDAEGELAIAREYCEVKELRSECSPDSIIVGRYSVLPYYLELEQDLQNRNSALINDYVTHKWVADFQYYSWFAEYTFPTWNDDSFGNAPEGSYIVKGRTNSRKHQWNTHMFAPNKKAASHIAAELMNESLIGSQGIIYRKYIPLETFEIGLNGLPFTNEWRFFFYCDRLLTYGYYWSQADLADSYIIPPEAIRFAQRLAKKVQLHIKFFVLDIAKTESGEWILVEINDAQMSGLCMCEPRQLYNNLQNEYNSIHGV